MQQLTNGTLLQGGRYKIIKTLGQGGFGITYLAEHLLLQRKVAIKEFFMKEHCNRNEGTSVVSVGSVGSVDLVERFKQKFLKEARLIAEMDNQHIVRVFDAFEENGTAYYVMEHLDNGCLNDMLVHVAFSEDTALKFTRQIADALKYIHEMNVLHLDVKPANVLLRKNGNAVLVDFGISKRYDETGGQTSTTPTGISKGYAPLEQYNQGVQNFSPCTDIYSLGATMYKMITGNTPPEASIVNEDGLPSKPDTITGSTWNAVIKAMCPRKKGRPQSVSEFMELVNVANRIPSVELGSVTDEETVLDGKDNVDNNILEESINECSSKDFDINGVKFKMVKVDGGTFDMKQTVSGGFMGLSSKEIVQKTTLSGYFIGETQVTQALWKAVMGGNPSEFKGDALPVESVSWNDCQKFIDKLNFMTGRSFRLPTEAQWEFAARGGNKSKGFEYSGSNRVSAVAWVSCMSGTHPVALKEPNEIGIFDMSGNVWEWCVDSKKDYSATPQINPVVTDVAELKVCRGGGWRDPYGYCRLNQRYGYGSDVRHNDLGLRLVLSE